MTAVVILLTVVVAILTLLVAGLLRSHATILKRLHELGAGVETSPTAAPPDTTAAPDDLDLPRPPKVPEGREAVDITGVGPTGEAHAIRVAGAGHDTVVAFLSSGCTTCHVFWSELRNPQLPTGTRLVVVTKGEDAESPVAVAELAPPDATVVMSSDTWTAYEVPGSPYVVHVDGESGRVRGEGTGPNWEQVRRMLLQGAGDADARRASKAAADAQREEEVDDILLAAGIKPGDPSLYVRADGTPAEPDA
ncbi:MAG: hypothetical protein GEU74_02580 [Nitriliruptorales bacterium]|nr:hypothetical protein [Nitriliruptorales bacterium]